jgi:tetratricopeptide (TPR) repeat protein
MREPEIMSRPVTPPKTITMMEDHDRAYQSWKGLAVRGRILVHVDAHIDFGWIPEMDLDEIGSDGKDLSKAPEVNTLLNPFLKSRKKMVNIGNYICPAIREGMVKKFYWVVPDQSWKSAQGLRYIIKQLKQILRINGCGNGKLVRYADHLSCRILGTEVIVCCLGALEAIEEPVLLDIDVDFMLTEHIWDDLNPERWPWIFPEELFEKISLKINDIDILTIAYSVEGGFTPLKFKYLGDELRLLFEGGLPAERGSAGHYKRKALLFEKENKLKEAVDAYERALSMDDSDASVYFNLAILYLGGVSKDAEKAGHFYNEAVNRDRSYATAYNNYGILYLRRNRLRKAQAEYKKFLGLSKDNCAVLNGLGHISLAQRRYVKAQEFFDQCLFARKDYPEARLGKGIVSFKQGRLKDAEELLVELKKDIPDEAEVYWWLGCIAQKRGEVPSAIENYKHAVMRGGEGPLVHLRLARHYLSRSFYYRAFEELKRSFQVLRILS